MKTKNNNVPNSILDPKQFKFFDFDNGIFVTEPYFVKLMKRTRDKLKYVDINYKKDKFCFSMRKAYCPICGTYHVKLKGYTSRKLIFLNNNKLNVLVQCYKCKKCGKSFQTELTGIVDKYCNFTNEIKEKSKFLIVEYLGSLNNVVKSFKELFNISVSHQTIENWLFEKDGIIELNSTRCSGYYLFDVEWVKINGKWNYRHTLVDAISKEIIADAIYDKEIYDTVYDFIKKTTLNKNIISITTDLDPKYEKIMEKLGFQHQLCIFHAKNALNKALKNKNLPKKEHKKAQKQLKKVTNIFDYEKYEKANKELQELNFKENEFIPEVWQIIKKLILPRYKKFIYHIQNKKIPKTSNLIENVFSKTMPKYKKRIFKTKKGLLKRIYEKDNLWNQNRQKQKAKNNQT